MRIRYLVLNAWGGGGTISTTLTNASSLARRGHEVEVVSVIRRQDDLRFPVHEGVGLTALIDLRERLPKKQRELAQEPSRDVPADENRYHRFNRLTDRRIRQYLADLEGGAVIATRPGLNLAVARHTPDAVIRIGQEHLFLDIQRNKPAQMAAMRESYPALDAHVSLTSDDARAYAEEFGIRTAAIPNAVRLSGSPATPDTLRSSRTVIAAGRLSGQKAFERLISAMALIGEHDGWRARIYGTGAQEAALRELIEQTGAPVDLMGFTTDLATELRAAGLFAMTSRFEGFPMVMLEAMGAGLPVATVSFRTGCHDLMTDGETGLIVPQDDDRALADALIRLMDSPEDRVAMGAAGYEVARSYTPQAIAGRWEELLERLAASRRGIRGLARRIRQRG